MRCLHRLKGRPNPEAEKALADADQNLKRIKERTAEVKEISKTSRIMRERNHFREQLEHIMGGPQHD